MTETGGGLFLNLLCLFGGVFSVCFFLNSQLKPNSLLGGKHNKIEFKAWRENTELPSGKGSEKRI